MGSRNVATIVSSAAVFAYGDASGNDSTRDKRYEYEVSLHVSRIMINSSVERETQKNTSSTYASPARLKASAMFLRKAVFSSGETSHSESQRSTVLRLLPKTSRSLLDAASGRRTLKTCSRKGDCLGRALNRLERLGIDHKIVCRRFKTIKSYILYLIVGNSEGAEEMVARRGPRCSCAFDVSGNKERM